MKKLLLLGGILASAWVSFAQGEKSSGLSWGTGIGQTYYDLHSNSTTGNRLVRNPEGSLSATWIEHWDFLDPANNPLPNVRGFGYNHFETSTGWVYGVEGECWEDNFGCASSYIGWPEIINIPGTSFGDDEMVLSHTGLKKTSRADINTGSWSMTSTMNIETDMGQGVWDGTWPRAVSSGDYIHLICTSSDQNGMFDGTGVEMPVVYFRSDDAGNTWSAPIPFNVVDTGYTTIMQIDTTWRNDTTALQMDTIMNGNYTVGNYTFNVDLFTPDTSILVVDTVNFITNYVSSGLDTGAIVSWGTISSIIDRIDTTYINDTTIYNMVNAVGGDAYQITANGSNVAITFGAGPDNDWLVFKSTDNGTTWNRLLVKNNHNLPQEFTGQNNSVGVITNADNFDIIIDDNGKVHAFAGMSMTDGQFVYADPELYRASGAGIMYWSEGMSAPEVVARPDYGLDGDTSNYNTKGAEFYGFFFQGWPAASFDEYGNIFLIYSAIAELTEYAVPNTTDTIGYNDLYMVYSLDNGATWCNTDDPVNIAEDIYGIIGATPTEDDLYPVTVAKIESDHFLHLTWQGDYGRPGVALYDDTHPRDNINFIQHAIIRTDCIAACNNIIWCPGSITEQIENNINAQLFPNPANQVTTISTDVPIYSIDIVNILGEVIRMEIVNDLKEYQLNVSSLPEGMYILKINTEEGTSTRKLQVIK